MSCAGEPKTEKRYAALALVTFATSIFLYLSTLAPSVSTIFDDSLEFQLVAYQLGIAHPTGYPLYVLLGKLFTSFPFGDVAYRVNMLSAVCGAATAMVLFLIVTRVGGHRVAGLAAGLALAVSPVFWSQSTIAEVYTLNTLLVALCVYVAVLWRESELSPNTSRAQRDKWFVAIALTVGLSLTHHRSTVFMLLPLLLFILLVNPRVLLRRQTLLGGLIALVAPLALYLLIPLRGAAISSLDGTYQNTLSGFLAHISGAGYNVFLTENPLNQSRSVLDFGLLFFQQFGYVGLVLAAIGFIDALRRWRPVWVLTAVAFLTYSAFAASYRVADFQVFFIPSFLFVAIWLGLGLALLIDLLSKLWPILAPRAPAPVESPMAMGSEPREVWRPSAELLGNAVGLVVPILFLFSLRPFLQTNYQLMDRTRDWSVHDYGIDILSQPLERGSAVVGLLGEMTLLRYFQQTEGLRPDVITIAADDEQDRRNAVAAQLAQNRAVYLTRPLPGIAGLYHLSAIGSLIQVQRRPGMVDVTPDVSSDLFLNDSIHLLGYDLSYLKNHWRLAVRLTLFWEVTGPIPASYKVSARVYSADGSLVGQSDAIPVHDMYETNLWQPGEVVRDVYDIPIVPGTIPGECKLVLVLYRPEDGAEVARAELDTVSIEGALGEPPIGELAVDRVVRAEALDGVQLLGYSLPADDPVFEQGEQVPINLLWRFSDGLNRGGALRIWLQDADAWLTLPIPQLGLSEKERPVGPVLLRQWVQFPVTARVPDGAHTLYLSAHASEAEAQAGGGAGILLGTVQVKGRERAFDVPAMQTQVGAILDRRVTLLGFDLDSRTHKPGDTLKVKLYWQAKAEMNASYTVFVHVVGEDGTIRAQQDIVPHGGEWPTTGWMEGEVVPDLHELTISDATPPGRYSLIAGMYRADTGQRLTATAGNNNPLGDFVLLTQIELN